MRTLFTLSVALLVSLAPVPLALAQDAPAGFAPTETTPAGARVPLEVAGGAGGMLTSFALGALTAEMLGAGECRGPDDDVCGLGASITGGLIGVGSLALTVPLGVYLAGNAAGGDGSFAAAFLGNLIGGGIGAGLVFGLAPQLDDGALVPLIVVAGALALGGSVLGYELTNGASARATARARARAGLRVMPSVAAARGGASVGLVGTF